MKRAFPTTLGLVLLAGCAGPSKLPQQQVQPPPFDSSEHRPYVQEGQASITGQAFLRQQGGGVVTCAGRRVALVPGTEYFRTVAIALAYGQRVEPPRDTDIQGSRLAREGQCDAQGNFAFKGLPAGRWKVVTDVQWTVAGKRQGGWLMKDVTVEPAGTAQVLLTDADRFGQ